MSYKRPAALFDFDGTITRSDSMLPFLGFVLRRHPRSAFYLPQIAILLGPYALGAVSKKQMKTAALRMLSVIEPKERQGLIEDFATSSLEGLYFQGALDRIRWHKEQGHLLVMISASIELYLQSAARHLGFDELIGTKVDTQSLMVVGANCFGKEKVNRLVQKPWFEDVDWANSWAYSDHIADLPILTLCGNPVATTPKKALRRHARQQGWPIMDWS